MKLVVTKKPTVTATTNGQSIQTLVDYFNASKIEEIVETGPVKLYRITYTTDSGSDTIQYNQADYIISILGG